MKNHSPLVIIFIKVLVNIDTIMDRIVNISICTNKNVNVSVKVFIYV